MQPADQDGARETLIQEALQKYWGFDSLRPLQREVVDSALNNRDAVVVLPTGGGKSLCFQLPAVVSESLTVVVSPLIALMKDQVDALTVVGVPSAALNSSMSDAEDVAIQQSLVDGKLRLLYVSPERLLTPGTMNLLKRAYGGQGVSRFAIDEAHCISAWGHDFRPEFRQLSRIKEVFPGIPVQAFTATATPQVQRDIAIQLKMERPRKFVGIFDRPNLTYRVVAKDDAVKRTVEAVQRYPDEGVMVYCLSRKDTEMIAEALVASGIKAVAYHAGLPADMRKKISEDFATERANIIVATVAFGMGIDRANVRCVIHECLPKSMEGYQQETGRAGRDGLPSECVLLYSHGDVSRLKRLLSDGDEETVAHHYGLLEQVRRFATSHVCRHKSLSEHFGQDYEVPEDGCGACDVCEGGMRPLDNSSEIANKILQTVANLLVRGNGRSFGAGYLVSVLIGSRDKVVIERRGDQSTGYGAFPSESKERVASWVHQLVDLGYLNTSEGKYPMVGMTPEGQVALAEGTEIQMMENEALLEPAGKKRSKPTGSDIQNVDLALFEKLRLWRREVATERSIPAYVIFHDSTLMKVAAARPSSLNNLRVISGVGDRRAEEFGEDLIDIVAEHVQETGVSLDAPLIIKTTTSASTEVTPRALTYFPLFRAGESIAEIAAKKGRQQITVLEYMATWIQAEKPASIDAYVDAETQKKVRAAFEVVGPDMLRPVFEYLEESVSYSVIRLLKSHYLATKE